MNFFRTVYVNFIEPFFISIVKSIPLKRKFSQTFFLFGLEHPLSLQSTIPLHSSTWELVDARVSAIAWFLSFILISN